jgi:aryl-alcohol dehydrogenase-like predicted oxidoreductase
LLALQAENRDGLICPPNSDFRNVVPRFTPAARKANKALVDQLSLIAARKHVSPVQLALAWLLAQINSAASMITMQGARYPEHLNRMVGR